MVRSVLECFGEVRTRPLINYSHAFAFRVIRKALFVLTVQGSRYEDNKNNDNDRELRD